MDQIWKSVITSTTWCWLFSFFFYSFALKKVIVFQYATVAVAVAVAMLSQMTISVRLKTFYAWLSNKFYYYSNVHRCKCQKPNSSSFRGTNDNWLVCYTIHTSLKTSISLNVYDFLCKNSIEFLPPFDRNSFTPFHCTDNVRGCLAYIQILITNNGMLFQLFTIFFGHRFFRQNAIEQWIFWFTYCLVAR